MRSRRQGLGWVLLAAVLAVFLGAVESFESRGEPAPPPHENVVAAVSSVNHPGLPTYGTSSRSVPDVIQDAAALMLVGTLLLSLAALMRKRA
jgi:hypothetical protein